MPRLVHCPSSSVDLSCLRLCEALVAARAGVGVGAAALATVILGCDTLGAVTLGVETLGSDTVDAGAFAAVRDELETFGLDTGTT